MIFTTTYNPGRKNISETLDKYKIILQDHPDTYFLFDNMKWHISYKRPHNLKDLLTNADIEKKTQARGTHPCKKLRCRTCRMMASQYVIYMLDCKKCKCQYIGQTSTSIGKRLISQRSDTCIKNRANKSDPNQFNDVNHDIKDVLSYVIDVASHDVNKRVIKEYAWIQEIKNFEPYGLNVKE